MLTLLTTTGTRPEAMALCQEFMAKQTYCGSVRWIIIDDGEKTCVDSSWSRAGWTVEILRPEPFWQPGKNTQLRNIAVGLSIISPEEKLVFIEDDDYYGPEYLSATSQQLDTADLIGEVPSKYFNVSTLLGKTLKPSRHTSLCQTAIKGAALKCFREVILPRGQRFVDIDLWKTFKGPSKRYYAENVLCIKGMPGRTGIGCGHKKDFGDIVEPIEWLGDAYRYYHSFLSDKGVGPMDVKALRGHPYNKKNRKKGEVYPIENKRDRDLMIAVGAVRELNEDEKTAPPKKKLPAKKTLRNKKATAMKKTAAAPEGKSKPSLYDRKDMRAEE